MIEVKCLACGKKIAEYSGPTGMDVPIESHYFTRIDGSRPEHGSSTANICPHCKRAINELEATIEAISIFVTSNPTMMEDTHVETTPDDDQGTHPSDD